MIKLENILVLIKGEDKTDNIEDLHLRDGYYTITFLGGKTYNYRQDNIKLYKDPKVIDLNHTMVLKDGMPLYLLKNVLVFKLHTRIYYENGFKETVDNQSVTLIQSILNLPKSKLCFEYLKQIANTVGLNDREGKNILANRYNQISFIREDCILSNFLSKSMNQPSKQKKHMIFPFGFNISQRDAVNNALLNSISVIEGPPGTGKTQTILNIIANAIINGETVAIVSSNNSATKNVLDKLNKYGLGFIAAFIAAYLGNGTNKKEFIENQMSELPDMEQWKLDKEQCNDIKDKLITMSEKLDKMLKVQNELSILNQEKEVLQLEYEHYMNYYDETNHNDHEMVLKKGIDYKKALEFLVLFEAKQKLKDSIFNYIYFYLRYGLRNRKFLRNSQDRKVAICQKLFYETRLEVIIKEIEEKTSVLIDYDFKETMAQYSDMSLRLLKAYLSDKYDCNAQRKSYAIDELWKKSNEFITDYPVILSTTYSLRSSLSSEFIYDYVIIDEASQVDLATGGLALSCAKKAIIVGDLKQLPNVVNNDIKERTNQIFDQYDLDEAYRYATNSLLSSVSTLFPNIPHTLLREHYRCHPKIIEFCNQKFYNNELIVLTESPTKYQPLTVYKTVKGNHKRDNINVRQVDVIQKEVIPELNLDVYSDSIGIVTPYRNQTEYLQELFKNTNVRADTVDKFQGQECDTIIISTVDDMITEFTDDPNRLNVAISRAIKQLVVVTDGNPSSKQSNLKDLIDYIEYNNFSIHDSKVYSIFDYLYKSYRDVRLRYLENKKKVSEYDSENLMYSLIREVLKSNDDFSQYDVATHVPLRMIIRDLSMLEEEVIRYVMASGTHVDFVIYSKITKKILLALEVDGYHYHKEGTKQSERDNMKNSVFDLYELPYLRFSTNGSGEKETLTNALYEIIK